MAASAGDLASESDARGAGGSKASGSRGGEQQGSNLQQEQRLFVPLTKRARANGAVYGVDVGESGLSRRRMELEIDFDAEAAGGERTV